MSIPLSKSNKGWHKLWFYLKNDAAAPLPIFTDRLIEEVPGVCRYGPIEKEQKRLGYLLKAITTIKCHILCGTSIIRAYHVRRLVPLMVHALPLYRMVPGVSFEGTVLVDEALPPSEVAQRIKEAMEPSKDTASGALDHVYPVLGHPQCGRN